LLVVVRTIKVHRLANIVTLAEAPKPC
jgi:hypothetical protein